LKAELYEKDVEADRQAYELKIKSLEDAIEKQTGQIEDFSTQLQEALKQAQQLAGKTVESAGKPPKPNVRAK
jgi:chaperonin cofactor prefoldin